MKKLVPIWVSLILIWCGESFAAEVNTFKNPAGIVVDPATNLIYVSNVNGIADVKDNNGFISRLKADGTVDELYFLRGGSLGINLSAPKGLAIMGNFLFVADLNTLTAFDLNQAKHLFTVNFGSYPVQHFYDVTVGPDNALLVSDGPANTIYRVEVMNQYRVTPFIQSAELNQPQGLSWISSRQMLLVAGGNSLLAFGADGQKVSGPGVFLNRPEGLTVDTAGTAFVTSPLLKGIYQISAAGLLTAFKIGLNDPADLAWQAGTNSLLVVFAADNSVKAFPLSSNTSP